MMSAPRREDVDFDLDLAEIGALEPRFEGDHLLWYPTWTVKDDNDPRQGLPLRNETR